MRINKPLAAVLSAAVALTLCSCSEPQNLSGRWIQNEGSNFERILTINEDAGSWDIEYTNSPKSNVDGEILRNDSSLVFQLNNLVYLGEGHQPAKTNPRIAKLTLTDKQPEQNNLRLEIEDERGYVLSGTWERVD